MAVQRCRLVRKYFEMIVDFESQKTFILGRETHPGRSNQLWGENCRFISCSSELVSRQHCRITCDEAGIWKIEDLKSTNGTYLNNVKILTASSYQRELRDGDVISLGVINEADIEINDRYFVFKFEMYTPNKSNNFSENSTGRSTSQKKASKWNTSSSPCNRSQNEIDIEQQSSSRSSIPSNKSAKRKEKSRPKFLPSPLDDLTSESEDDSSDGCSTERNNVVLTSSSTRTFHSESPKKMKTHDSYARNGENHCFATPQPSSQSTKNQMSAKLSQLKPNDSKFKENKSKCSVNLTNIFQSHKGHLYLVPSIKKTLKSEGCSFSDETVTTILDTKAVEKKRPVSESESEVEIIDSKKGKSKRLLKGAVIEISDDSEDEDANVHAKSKHVHSPPSRKKTKAVRPVLSSSSKSSESDQEEIRLPRSHTRKKTKVVKPLRKENKYGSSSAKSSESDQEEIRLPRSTSSKKTKIVKPSPIEKKYRSSSSKGNESDQEEIRLSKSPSNKKSKVIKPIEKKYRSSSSKSSESDQKEIQLRRSPLRKKTKVEKPLLKEKKYRSGSSKFSEIDQEEIQLQGYSKPSSDEEVNHVMDYDDIPQSCLNHKSDEETDATVNNVNQDRFSRSPSRKKTKVEKPLLNEKKYRSGSSKFSEIDQEEIQLPGNSKPSREEEANNFMDYDDIPQSFLNHKSDEETDATINNVNQDPISEVQRIKKIVSGLKPIVPHRQTQLIDHAPTPYSYSKRKLGVKERTSIISPGAVPVKKVANKYTDSIDEARKASEERNEIRKRKLNALSLRKEVTNLEKDQNECFKRPNIPKVKVCGKNRSDALYKEIDESGSSVGNSGLEPKPGCSRDILPAKGPIIPLPSKEIQENMPLKRILTTGFKATSATSDRHVPTNSSYVRQAQAVNAQLINRTNAMQKPNSVVEDRQQDRNADVQFHINMKNQIVNGPMRKDHVDLKLYDDTIYQDICKWEPAWLEEQITPPLEEGAYNNWTVLSTLYSYSNFSSYQTAFYPLMLHELWTGITEDAVKNTKLPGGECQVSVDKVIPMESCPMLTQDLFAPKKGVWVELRCHSLGKDTREFRNTLDFCVVKYNWRRKNSRNECVTHLKQTFAFTGNCQNEKIEPIKHDTTVNKKLYNQDRTCRFKFSFSVYFHERQPSVGEIAQDLPCTVERIAYISPKIREYKAFISLPKLRLYKNILFPPKIDNPWTEADIDKTNRNLVPYCTSLNPRQKSVIDYISKRIMKVKQPDIMLIHGPPGTGKTRTIVGLILQLVTCQDHQGEIPRILVCTPSNTAIDEIVVRIHEYFQDKSLNHRPVMVRLGDSSKTAETSRQYTPEFLAGKQKTKNSPVECLENTIQAKKEEIEQKKVEKSINRNMTNIIRLKAIVREIKELEDQIEVLEQQKQTLLCAMGKPTDDLVKVKNEIIKSAHIVCSTLNSCTNSKMKNLFEVSARQSSMKNPPSKFTCCIIDEATQTTEPETLAPLIFNMEKLVMVGDPCQLDATVLSKKAKDSNYGFSLFHRLYNTYNNQNPNPVMMLRNQYRMHSEILKWPNDYFYGGKLIQKPIRKAGSYVECPLPPYAFFNLSSEESSNYRGEISNEQEMTLVVELLKSISFQLNQSRNPFTVGVITPYTKQKSLLSDEIRRKVPSFASMVEVDTVDSFQGREKDIIIISCVRTESFGFITNSKRLNVALTRAVHSLFIIGNANFLKKNEMWESLIEDAESRKFLLNIPKAKAHQTSFIANFFRKNLAASKSEIPPENRMHRRLDRL